MSQNLETIGRKLVKQSKLHEGQTDGFGYVVEESRPGRGFSCVEYSKKELTNGYSVTCYTYYPGPFDALAGLPSEIEQEYWVFAGWEAEHPDENSLSLPPQGVQLPTGAISWNDYITEDGHRNWSAVFNNHLLAEAYGNSLPTWDLDRIAEMPWIREAIAVQD
jgi:hypothetical protein